MRSDVVGVTVIVMCVGLLITRVSSGAEERAKTARSSMWNFDADQPGYAPAGFSFGRTGTGRLGRWIVQAEPNAPSKPHVLAQVDSDGTDYRFPIAVADAPLARDLRLSVRCQPVAGHVDQACGLVFRYQDDHNYYVTRANALEGNVRLYHVVHGTRRQLAGWDGSVTTGAWHELVVEAKGEHFVISWDGHEVINAHDRTLLTPGNVGLWTKADSVTYFDNLKVELPAP